MPLHQQPWLLDLLRAAAAPLALALVALVVVFKLIRPALNGRPRHRQAPVGGKLDVVADNDTARRCRARPCHGRRWPHRR